MGIMKQPVADGIGLIRVPNGGMPLFDGELACDQGGGVLGSILDDFDQVPTFAIFEWGEEPIIDGHEIEAGETVE